MKIILIIAIAVLLAIVAYSFFVESPFQNSDVDVSLSIDKTDSFKATPDVNQLCSFLHIDDHKWSDITIKINPLSNFEYNPSHTVLLGSQSFLFSNPDQRDSAMAQFKKETASQLNSINAMTTGRPNSSIYIPLIRELNRLAKSKAKTRLAIFYTDMRENTKAFSLYRKKDLELLKSHPEEVKKMFMQLEKPGDLKGIKMYFIFEPGTDRENFSFNLMSAFMKKLLEDAGAEVYVGANLPIEQN